MAGSWSWGGGKARDKGGYGERGENLLLSLRSNLTGGDGEEGTIFGRIEDLRISRFVGCKEIGGDLIEFYVTVFGGVHCRIGGEMNEG